MGRLTSLERGPGRRLRRLARGARGQALAIAAIALPVVFGMGALAVDVGYIYVARNVLQNAADAGARAGAGVLATGGTQAQAQQTATQFANQNVAANAFLAGANPVVAFPNATTIQVSFNFNLPLFFAPVIGVNTAAVPAVAAAAIAPVGQVGGGAPVPIALYCNNPSGCDGVLAVNQALNNIFRHCGNFFGTSGGVCNWSPNTPGAGEVFLTGVSFDNNLGTDQFRTDVENGLPGTVSIGQVATALPGRMQGWESAMINRLNAGQNEMTFIVIRPVGGNPPGSNVQVVDFVRVRVDNFNPAPPAAGSQPDLFNITILPQLVSNATSFAAPGQGVGVNSVVGVRLTQ